MSTQEPVTLTDVLELMERSIMYTVPEDGKNIDTLVQKLNALFANEMMNDIICSEVIILLTLAESWKKYLKQHDHTSTNIPPYLQG